MIFTCQNYLLLLSELRESSGRKKNHEILFSVHLCALIGWHFSASSFNNPLIEVYIMILIVCINPSWYPWYLFSPLSQNSSSCLFFFRWCSSYKSALYFTCCCTGKLLASNFMTLNLCVKPEIVFFCSHLMLQTQSEHFICGHDGYLAALSFLLIVLPQYAWHVNQFNLIS